jgi:hypothetical protein
MARQGTMSFVCCWAVASTLLGCAKETENPSTRSAGADIPKIRMIELTTQPTTQGPRDATPAVPLKVYLEMYQLSVPLWSVGKNDDFWKRVDENVIDVAGKDLLLKNGIRVGVAPTAEWEYFKKIIDQNPAAVRTMMFKNAEAQGAEWELKGAMVDETIFTFDEHNEPVGRTYTQCANLLSITFQPVPRKLGDVRVAVCPLVRGLRKELVYNALEQSRGVEFVSPEYLYDLNLVAEVPLEHFMVVAPSPAAEMPMSLGANFLIDGSAAERMEQIILLVPRQFRLEADGTPAKPPSNR